jgi:hypothetical protein
LCLVGARQQLAHNYPPIQSPINTIDEFIAIKTIAVGDRNRRIDDNNRRQRLVMIRVDNNQLRPFRLPTSLFSSVCSGDASIGKCDWYVLNQI